METILVKSVNKSFGEIQVLHDVNLTAHSGEIIGIIGRNGCGKTVLFKCICGLTAHDSGQIVVLGDEIGKKVDMAKNVGILIENPMFLSDYNAFGNLKILASIQRKISDTQIRECLSLVGLENETKKKVGKFSMGMRQRLGIAQAIMENPEILILDEPMNGLDYSWVERMRKLLLEWKGRGKTILLASHNAEDIEILCDVVYHMENGYLTKKEI